MGAVGLAVEFCKFAGYAIADRLVLKTIELECLPEGQCGHNYPQRYITVGGAILANIVLGRLIFAGMMPQDCTEVLDQSFDVNRRFEWIVVALVEVRIMSRPAHSAKLIAAY